MAMGTAAAFRAQHAGQRILVLPNVWDAASAALFRKAGAPAIATTSAGLAWACGFADGDLLPRAELLFMVRAIARACESLPLSVDLESGYSSDPLEVAELAGELRTLGVVGINLEDGTDTPQRLAAKIEAVKRTCGDGMFVNARTDVYLDELASGSAAIDETIARAQSYARAGADGIFVPALPVDAIEVVARATTLPLGIFAVRGLPSLAELYGLGIRRLSAGPALAKLAYGTARHAARAFLADDRRDEALFSPHGADFAEMNALFV